MKTIANTKENSAIVETLKKINQCKWVGNVTHDSLDKCLAGINLDSAVNSGWYNPIAARINGLTGIYMINENGSICFDYRVIKESEKTFRIETLTNEGFNDFETIYSQMIKA